MCGHCLGRQWADYLPNGVGLLTFLDGSSYKGNFAAGVRVGLADFWWPNGDHMKVRATVVYVLALVSAYVHVHVKMCI